MRFLQPASTDDRRYSAYHHSHPTLTERLKALDGFHLKQFDGALAAKKEL